MLIETLYCKELHLMINFTGIAVLELFFYINSKINIIRKALISPFISHYNSFKIFSDGVILFEKSKYS